ncbi:hypothetical protein [Nocardiopsis coralliicola]
MAEQMGDSGAATPDRLRAAVASTPSPPLPRAAVLGEAIVHGKCIRRPLGIGSNRPNETLIPVADYYRGSDQAVVAESRGKGLRRKADDGPSASGSGPLAPDSTLPLVMVMTGRPAHLDRLTGGCVETLRARMAV